MGWCDATLAYISFLSLCLAGWLSVRYLPILSMTMIKLPSLTCWLKKSPAWIQHLSSDPSTISIHVVTLRTAAIHRKCTKTDQLCEMWVDEVRSANRSILARLSDLQSGLRNGWSLKSQRHLLQAWILDMNEAQWLKGPFNGFPMALRLVYYIIKHIFYHPHIIPPWQWIHFDLMEVDTTSDVWRCQRSYNWPILLMAGSLAVWGKNKARDIGITVMWDMILTVDTWKVQNHAAKAILSLMKNPLLSLSILVFLVYSWRKKSQNAQVLGFLPPKQSCRSLSEPGLHKTMGFFWLQKMRKKKPDPCPFTWSFLTNVSGFTSLTNCSAPVKD